jgi:hypothetical protein
MSSKQNLYTGRSGQMAVMALFLFRGYNVAIPEIDVGEDIFVVKDEDGDLSRIQVKAAISKGNKILSGVFNVPLIQLWRPHEPELHYVFTLNVGGSWKEYIVIRRDDLKKLHDVNGIGNVVAGRSLILRMSFTALDVQCNGTSLQSYRDDWSSWPPIQH